METTHSQSHKSGKFNFVQEVKDAISIIKLDEKVMLNVAERKHATWFGLVIFALPAVLNLILFSLSFPSGFGAIAQSFFLWSMLIPVLSLVGTIFLISEIALRGFKGKGKTVNFFRAVSYVGVIFWVSVISSLLTGFGIAAIPQLFNLSWIATLVMIFVVSYKMLIAHHKLAPNDVIVVLVLGVVGYFILQNLLGRILVGGSYKFFY